MSNVITNWKNLNLHMESSDVKKTDEIFYEKHPSLVGKKLDKDSIFVKDWKSILEYVIQNKYNDIIEDSVKQFTMITPKVLKALLVQESRFNTKVINSYGYGGIAQFGVTSGKEEGLIINDQIDERLIPEKAIPAAVRHLRHKWEAIKSTIDKYNIIDNIEIIKFILASYNGGQGTIIYALNYESTKSKGPWSWLEICGEPKSIKQSALYAATYKYFSNIRGKDLSVEKYHEIGNYPILITNLELRAE